MQSKAEVLDQIREATKHLNWDEIIEFARSQNQAGRKIGSVLTDIQSAAEDEFGLTFEQYGKMLLAAGMAYLVVPAQKKFEVDLERLKQLAEKI